MEHDEEIRLTAYRIWEDEGRPNGCDLDHWFRAEIICANRHDPEPSPALKTPAAPKTTRKAKAKEPAARRRKSKS